MNPLTHESREARFNTKDVPGLGDTLRAPETVHRLIMLGKPASQPVSDFCLMAMLKSVLLDLIVRERFDECYRVLGNFREPPLPSGAAAPGSLPGGNPVAPWQPPPAQVVAQNEALGLGHRSARNGK